jgi:hypothetical protein
MGVRIDHEAQAQSAISELLQIAHHAVGPWVHEGGCARLGVRDEVREAALRAQLIRPSATVFDSMARLLGSVHTNSVHESAALTWIALILTAAHRMER